MADRELAARAILEKAILDELTEANADTRQQLAGSGIEPGDRVTVRDLGHVLMTNPKPGRRVVDWAAFTRWVETYAPDQIITTVQISPGFIKRLTTAGEYVDPESGEVLVPDGLGTTVGTPQLRVDTTDVAKDVARGLLGRALAELEAAPGAES
ncbi:MAG: hypothetical protein QM753_06905 [Thermomicrobiales bacterium]